MVPGAGGAGLGGWMVHGALPASQEGLGGVGCRRGGVGGIRAARAAACFTASQLTVWEVAGPAHGRPALRRRPLRLPQATAVPAAPPCPCSPCPLALPAFLQPIITVPGSVVLMDSTQLSMSISFGEQVRWGGLGQVDSRCEALGHDDSRCASGAGRQRATPLSSSPHCAGPGIQPPAPLQHQRQHHEVRCGLGRGGGPAGSHHLHHQHNGGADLQVSRAG